MTRESTDSSLIASTYAWSEQRETGWHVAWAGDLKPAEIVSEVLESTATLSTQDLGERLQKVPGQFSFLAENQTHLVAASDRVRAYPVFYSDGREDTLFSNSARLLRERLSLQDPDPISLLEGLMAGYVTGQSTLYEGLKQLQAAEIAVFAKEAGTLSLDRYYEFLPQEIEQDEDQLIERLGAATEQIFLRVIERADGRPLVVPLSGGLDSRLVLAMLKWLGYPTLRAFSYGVSHNQEAQRARIVAERLGVPWSFHPSIRKSARALFRDAQREDYWRSADGLCSLPNMQEYQPFAELIASGSLSSEAVVVNGQSGDFITGGHLRPALLSPEAGCDAAFDAVVDKHYSLWKSLKTPENLTVLRERFDTNIRSALERGCTEAGRLYEYWEWEERQSKFVVNQQRTYDFFGLSWMLPLWDLEYCELWREVPLRLRLDQRLYKRYLERWDYKGLFSDPELRKPMVGWTGITRPVTPLARLAGAVGGEAAKDTVYRLFKYFGFKGHYLACYPYAHYWERSGNIRNPASLFAETWIGDLFPECLEKHLPYSALMRG